MIDEICEASAGHNAEAAQEEGAAGARGRASSGTQKEREKEQRQREERRGPPACLPGGMTATGETSHSAAAAYFEARKASGGEGKRGPGPALRAGAPLPPSSSAASSSWSLGSVSAGVWMAGAICRKLAGAVRPGRSKHPAAGTHRRGFHGAGEALEDYLCGPARRGPAHRRAWRHGVSLKCGCFRCSDGMFGRPDPGQVSSVLEGSARLWLPRECDTKGEFCYAASAEKRHLREALGDVRRMAKTKTGKPNGRARAGGARHDEGLGSSVAGRPAGRTGFGRLRVLGGRRASRGGRRPPGGGGECSEGPSACEVAALDRVRERLRPLLKAVRRVESGWIPIDKVPDGDGGTAIGPLQISRAYHADAWGSSSSSSPSSSSPSSSGDTGGMDYERCRDLQHAERTCAKYWMTFCPCAVHDKDFEVLARAHNGGIGGVFEHYGTTPDYHAKILGALRGQKRQDRCVTAAAFLAVAAACYYSTQKGGPRPETPPRKP